MLHEQTVLGECGHSEMFVCGRAVPGADGHIKKKKESRKKTLETECSEQSVLLAYTVYIYIFV